MAKILIGSYEGSIYEENGGWTGALSLGFGPDGKRKRLKRKGKTKTEVKSKLIEAVRDLERGVKAEVGYTVARCVTDFLAHGLKGKSAGTLRLYTSLATNHIVPKIGAVKLKDLAADDVDEWLEALAAHLSSETVGRTHDLLRRSIRMAQRRDKVFRNVAELVDTPEGQKGRPSKSLTLEQAVTLLKVAQQPEWRLGAYVWLCLLSGIRTEEARALTWDDVDLSQGVVYVLRADRHKGETKTSKSRRGFGIAKLAVSALAAHKVRQAAERLAAGKAWRDNNLVFCHGDGSPFDPAQVRYDFRKITTAAGLGDDWVPRELRHTFVSLMSNHGGVAIEKISDLVGHSSTAITETIYRHELRPVIMDGAQAMDKIFVFKSA
ncbi:site-specific integrase [Nonomuraea roseoviolacea]|uniref:Integrase n=1 Tax=Nonomuraea roseoviolacea subsp. carminata TaxID=160689 RepID=A0ABT1JV30_9ACTN|nr:site-specific integrase [Nonomuraea roseoviolacea]MCP2345126.1 integrase [Nonomuraea roseoviolacea subsp. carminata]